MTTETKMPYAILYVDDEEQSLKYFRKAFEKEFTIHTAANADEALKILAQHADSIGILITDQRMPGTTGVQLLEKVRREHPEIVRMLTTAYSDLQSAIDAVNTGAIFRYVVKPWDVRDLRGTLLRGLDYFIIQRERNLLLREKLSVLQRIIIADRVHSLAVLATGLAHHIRNSMTALSTFLELTPMKLHQEVSNAQVKNPEFWGDVWSLAQKESQRILEIVKQVTDSTVEDEYSFDDKVDAAKALEQAAKAASVGLQVSNAKGVSSINGNAAMLQRMFSILINRVSRLNEKGAKLSAEILPEASVWGAAGCRIHLKGDAAWTPEQIAGLFNIFSIPPDNPQELGLDLLSAFFIAHHHGGDIAVGNSSGSHQGFSIVLPYNPSESKRPSLQQDCLEKMFNRLSADSVV